MLQNQDPNSAAPHTVYAVYNDGFQSPHSTCTRVIWGNNMTESCKLLLPGLIILSWRPDSSTGQHKNNNRRNPPSSIDWVPLQTRKASIWELLQRRLSCMMMTSSVGQEHLPLKSTVLCNAEFVQSLLKKAQCRHL